MQQGEKSEGTLRIGAVARITGVSVHTLRKWEDRYGAVEPRRTEGGDRLYTRTDVERLGFIRRLAEGGVSLREVARMSLDELARAWEQLASTTGAAAGGSRRPVRVALVGDTAGPLLSRAEQGGRLVVVAVTGHAESLEAALDGERVDVLVCECPSVVPATENTVHALMERAGARAALVLYRFGARRDLVRLRGRDIATLRAPAEPGTLAQALATLVQDDCTPEPAEPARMFQSDTEIPAPRLSHEAVMRLAGSAPRTQCECPHHLADILLGLRAFEEYSADCENRNEEDAELHRYLWRRTAQARALFEEAVEHLARVEGISLGG